MKVDSDSSLSLLLLLFSSSLLVVFAEKGFVWAEVGFLPDQNDS